MITKLVDLFAKYPIDVITVLVIIALAVFLYFKGYKKFLNELVLSLVVEAEQILGSGTGKFKFNHAMTEVYKVLPLLLKLLFPKAWITKLIEDNVTELNKFLKSGGNLLEYKFKVVPKDDTVTTE